MRRFPSMKSVLFCGFAAMVMVLSVPANPHVAMTNKPAPGAVPTLGNATVTSNTAADSGGGKSNKKANRTSNSTGNSTTNNTQNGAANNTTNGTETAPSPASPKTKEQGPNAAPIGPESWGYTKARTSRLRVHVIDGRTRKPLQGAEVVVIENEKRYRTDSKGYTPWFDAPVIRNPRYRPMVAELHGQLGVIVYKNGYRDSVHLGIRMHEDIKQQTTVWMYKIGPEDRRIEPVLYQEPYHHIWLIELADKFRQKSQIGEGPERP